jgi:hypothetical protein
MTAMNQQFRPQGLQAREAQGGEPQPGGFQPGEGIVLTPEQSRSRRARNIAIGLAVGFFALLFYAVTIAKLIHFGPGFLATPM